MVSSPGLALSPAQRSFVDKGRAAQRAKSEKDAIKLAIEDATRRRIDETKARCKAQQHARDVSARDRKLIIRHVGEELARLAQRSDVGSTVKKKQTTTNATTAAVKQSNNSAFSGAPTAPAMAEEDDGYDEERYGPARRPPRPQKPNLWLQLFEQEQKEVKHEREEDRRKRLATAAELRLALAKQEADKAAQRQAVCRREDEYAKLQAQQVATWKEQEKTKERARQQAAEEETKRCKDEFRMTHEQRVLAQKKREQQELKTIARYNAMMEEEKKQQELKKHKLKEEFAKVAEANALQLAIKQQERMKEQEEEVRLQHEYTKKLAEQEEARQRELQEVLAKQSRRVKMALLNVKSAEEKAREDEERAAIVQAQVRAREEQERLRREQKKREVIATQTQALKEQKEEKRQRFREEAKDEHQYATEFKQDYLAWVEVQKQKQVQVKQKNLSHETLVMRQIKEDAVRRANEDKYGMSQREMALNATLLRRIGVDRPPSDAASR